jgi:stage II sporulation protein AB (anti-sigma F factor)
MYINKMSLRFTAKSENEGFARLAVASFCSNVIKDVEVISDIKTAVSEAVTNAIVHGYDSGEGEVDISCVLNDCEVTITIEDAGVGIEDVEQAKKPFFTTKPNKERSGMGFTVMEGFMDKVVVESGIGVGTRITLIKQLDSIA